IDNERAGEALFWVRQLDIQTELPSFNRQGGGAKRNEVGDFELEIEKQREGQNISRIMETASIISRKHVLSSYILGRGASLLSFTASSRKLSSKDCLTSLDSSS